HARLVVLILVLILAGGLARVLAAGRVAGVPRRVGARATLIRRRFYSLCRRLPRSPLIAHARRAGRRSRWIGGRIHRRLCRRVGRFAAAVIGRRGCLAGRLLLVSRRLRPAARGLAGVLAA